MEYKRKLTEKQTGAAEIYEIHDNGGRPFKVVIGEKKVDVFKVADFDDEKREVIYATTPIITFEPIRIFIGKSPINSMTKYSGGHGPKFDGNTILLQTDSNTYVWIGSEISSFETDSKIIEFVSPVGNSDVPYPYATDENGNVYLIIENVVLVNSDKTQNNMRAYDDPYEYYYDYALITPDKGRIPPKLAKSTFHGITKYYIGRDPYTFRYNPFPEKDYERLIPEYGSKMYIVDDKKKKTILTKEAYVKLMKEFGAERGFKPIVGKKIIIERT